MLFTKEDRHDEKTEFPERAPIPGVSMCFIWFLKLDHQHHHHHHHHHHHISIIILKKRFACGQMLHINIVQSENALKHAWQSHHGSKLAVLTFFVANCKDEPMMTNIFLKQNS